MDNTRIVESLMTIRRLAYIAHCELEVYDQLTDYIWNVWTLALIEDGSLYVIYTSLITHHNECSGFLFTQTSPRTNSFNFSRNYVCYINGGLVFSSARVY